MNTYFYIAGVILASYIILLMFFNKPGDWGEKPLSKQDALYALTTTFSTAGYGDITPKSNKAKNFIIIIQLLIIIEIFSLVKNLR